MVPTRASRPLAASGSTRHPFVPDLERVNLAPKWRHLRHKAGIAGAGIALGAHGTVGGALGAGSRQAIHNRHSGKQCQPKDYLEERL